MGLIGRLTARFGPPPHPLGEGLWRRDFDRVDRASQRVLQVLSHQQREAPALVHELTACRELVWRCCSAAFERSPGTDQDVPGDDGLAAAHHALSRAATAVSQVAQALVIAQADPVAADRPMAQAMARAHDAALALELDG
ncbi:hypothetical protein [Aquipuribacter sp. MA13-6]|uniref:hypothetical protein n=1 Tax=unclassified Aquipuribacter TaxID=2635084 RepID=UPI003EEAE4D2